MSHEISNIYTVDTAERFPLGRVSFDGNTGWQLKFVSFASGAMYNHGDVLSINAAFAASERTGNKINGVVIQKGGVDALSATKYGWVACPGSVNPVWVNYPAFGESGSDGEASGGLDVNGFRLVQTASGNAYDLRGKAVAELTLSANVTGSTAQFTSANLNATMVKVEDMFAGRLRAVSALSAFTATGNEQSAYLRTVPAGYVGLVAANTAQISATGNGISAKGGISAYLRAGDVAIYEGESRNVVSGLTAQAGYSVVLASGFANTAAVTAPTIKVGHLKVLAEFI
jgi:hypothetical protein